jgi:WD40 repeat protein
MPKAFVCPDGHEWEGASDFSTAPLACPVCGAGLPARAADGAAAPVAEPPSGSLSVPGYETLEELGRGGMGVVYLARQVGLNRLVALKMIRDSALADPEQRARFRGEAEAVARLQHPHIVQVYEIGEHLGLPYFSLEFCAGGSLAARLDGTPRLPGEAAALVETLARAMHDAHQAGVIHRDLKPANVLLSFSRDPQGSAEGAPLGERPLHEATLKITDFGLAKRLDGPGGQTQSGAIVGTPSYMAPEQAGGKGKEVGPATDVYALGAILYECLTGRPPFRAATALDTVLQVLSDDLVPPRQIQPKVPRDLETICLKCLHKEPQKRYASALELAADLRRFQGGEAILARPVGPGERVLKWAKRRPALAALLATLVLAAVGLLVGGGWFTFQLNAARVRAEDLAGAKGRARADAVAEGEWSRRLLYDAKMNLIQPDFEANNIGRVQELLEELVPKAGEDDLRSFEWYYWHRVSHRELRTFQAPEGSPVSSVALSPDGRHLAAGGNWGDGTVRVWDVTTGQQLPALPGHRGRVSSVAFSPDGRRLASGSKDDGTVRVRDMTTRQELSSFSFKGGPHGVWSVTFSPDGRRLATGQGDGTVRVCDAATGQQLQALKGDPGSVYSVAFSPDGRRLAAGGDDGTVRVWDAATGQQLQALKGHTGSVYSVAFGPDGRRLAFAVIAADDPAGRMVRVWDAATGQQLQALKGHTDLVTSVAFSPDGRLASGSYDGTVRVWDAATGQQLQALVGHTDLIDSVAFSPDGFRLASGGLLGTIQIWAAPPVHELFSLKEGGTSVAFSPDGKVLASGNWGRMVRVWDATTGQQLQALKGHTDLVTSVAFSPDGRRLAGDGNDGTVRVWNVTTGQQLQALSGDKGAASSVAFSPDGRRLAAAGGTGGTMRVWDVTRGQELLSRTGRTHKSRSLAFSPNGRHLASGSRDGTVLVWDTATWQEPRVLQGARQGVAQKVAFSPDSNRLASGGDDGTVRVWDAVRWQELHTLKGHRGEVNSVAFSPKDGRRLASGGNDGTVRVWDVTTGQQLLSFMGGPRGVLGVAFSPDGLCLAASNFDKVRVWEASSVPEDVWRKRAVVAHVDALFDELRLPAEVLARLKKDTRWNDSDREFALELVRKKNP